MTAIDRMLKKLDAYDAGNKTEGRLPCSFTDTLKVLRSILEAGRDDSLEQRVRELEAEDRKPQSYANLSRKIHALNKRIGELEAHKVKPTPEATPTIHFCGTNDFPEATPLPICPHCNKPINKRRAASDVCMCEWKGVPSKLEAKGQTMEEKIACMLQKEVALAGGVYMDMAEHVIALIRQSDKGKVAIGYTFTNLVDALRKALGKDGGA